MICIQSIHFDGNPLAFITLVRNSQSMESKALAKSIFAKIAGLAEHATCCKISLVGRKFSVMCLSRVKAVCCAETKSGSTDLNLLARTLVMSFGIRFMILIGLKSPTVAELGFLGIITMLALLVSDKSRLQIQKSSKILYTSSFSNGQKSLKNSCRRPSRPGALLFANCLTALCISKVVNGYCKWLRLGCSSLYITQGSKFRDCT